MDIDVGLDSRIAVVGANGAGKYVLAVHSAGDDPDIQYQIYAVSYLLDDFRTTNLLPA